MSLLQIDQPQSRLKIDNPQSTLKKANVIFSRPSIGTYLGKDGLLHAAGPNEPRFNYNPDGSFDGLLIEEESTNMVLYSTDLSGSAWYGGGADFEKQNNYLQKVILKSGVNELTIQQNHVVPADNEEYSFYIDIKNISVSYFKIAFDNSLTYSSKIDLQTLTINRININLFDSLTVNMLEDGFIRILATQSTPSTRFGMLAMGADGDFLMRGIQSERGSVRSSYIPTNGAPVTRAADELVFAT